MVNVEADRDTQTGHIKLRRDHTWDTICKVRIKIMKVCIWLAELKY